METFQHCRDKCLHSVVSDTTNLGVYDYQRFPPIDAHFFFPGTADSQDHYVFLFKICGD